MRADGGARLKDSDYSDGGSIYGGARRAEPVGLNGRAEPAVRSLSASATPSATPSAAWSRSGGADGSVVATTKVRSHERSAVAHGTACMTCT